MKPRKNIGKVSIRAAPKLSRPSQPKPLSESPERMHRRLWLVAKVIGGFLIGLVGLLASIYGIWGVPWPSVEIHPHDALNGSSLRLPFTIKNNSVWSINNAEMTCGLDWAYFQDARGTKANFFQIAIVTDVLSIPAGSPPVNYECDASQLIKVNPDGSWNLSAIAGIPVPFWPPLDFQKMCLWIRGDYHIAGIPWNFTSTIFEWPAESGVPQWLEGPTYRRGKMLQDDWIIKRHELPAYVGLPAAQVVCSPKPHVSAITFNRDGTVTFGPERLKTLGIP